MSKKKNRFDCLKEEEKEGKNMFKDESNKKSKEGGRFHFEEDDRRNSFGDDRNNFGDDRNNFGNDRRNNFRQMKVNRVDTFDEDRGGTYGRSRGTNKYRGQNFNSRDAYNSFNKRKKFEDPIKKEEPKKEFKMADTDFPTLG